MKVGSNLVFWVNVTSPFTPPDWMIDLKCIDNHERTELIYFRHSHLHCIHRVFVSNIRTSQEHIFMILLKYDEI